MVTLSDYVTAYAARRLNLSAPSVLQYRIAVRSLEKHVGGPVALSDLSEVLILRWLKALRETHAAPTCNSKRQAILTLWAAAARDGLASPVPEVESFAEPDRLPVVLDADQVEAIWRAVDSQPGTWGDTPVWLGWRIGLNVLWDTGCRIGELVAAKLSDVWLDRSRWLSPATNRKGKRADKLYTLHADTIHWIEQSLPSTRVKLFPFPWCRRMLWQHYERILAAAGVPCDREHKFHCLRRTVESLAAANRGVAWAAEAIGHTEEVARRHYVSPLIAPPPALVDAIPRPISPGPRLRVV